MKSIFLYIAFLLASISAHAQLQADFTMDKDGGCSPLAVSFTNTSTGASSNAVYHWNFDNGNTSVLKNPGAIFYTERTYAITLTVSDGSLTSSKTKQVTVYRKPLTDFIVSPASGCLPLQATLTSTSTPGDGTLTSFHWDFGDGITQQSNLPAITHQYSFLQTATVSLTVVNSHGCSNTMIKPGVVTVHPTVQASFNTATPIACAAPATIQFNNNSTGPGTLSYLWEFGDNETSTAAQPSHIYQQRGTYTVKLTVTSSEGCSASFTQTAYINVANFTTSFEEPAVICSNGPSIFANTSTPAPVFAQWLFDNTNNYVTIGNNAVTHAFATPGPHTVQLTNRFGPCQETITRTIDVKAKPRLDGFNIQINSECGAPVTVNFQDTTQAATSWAWNFNWPFNTPGFSSDQQSPTHTYTSDNAYQVSLTVTTGEGCSATVVKPVGISKPLVGIYISNGYTLTACNNLTTKFETRSTEAIVSYQWDFGDGTPLVLDVSEPMHTYTMPGTYRVSLTYTTVNGCTGTVYYNSIYIREKPVADFTVPSTICGNTPVSFTPTTTGYVVNHSWNFGDHTGFITVHPNIHKYESEGVYDVTMIAYNGMCNDTITKTAVIRVFPPFPKITSAANTCEGTRGLVTFSDASRQAEGWHWNFGDNATTSYAIAQPTVQHEYGATGSYKVVLTTTNGTCAVKDSIFVPVLLKQSPVLVPNTNSICFGSSVTVLVSGLERQPFPVTSPNYEVSYNYRGFWNPDGTPFVGNVSGGPITQFPWSAMLYNFPYGETQVRLFTESTYFGCRDTSAFLTINVRGPSAAINVLTNNVCFKEQVVLQDVSIARNNNAIVRCEWNFGDNTTQVTAAGATVSHRYATPGAYWVTLKVTDASGCTSTVTEIVRVAGPKAIFTASATNVPLSTAVNFSNTSNTFDAPGVSWQWDFGGLGNATNLQPSFTFNTAGSYVVTLIATNPVIACADTARQTIVVNTFNGGFGIATTLLGAQGKCPPVLARFQTAATNWLRLTWDFGDGVTLIDQTSPTHIYSTPGTYIVTLTVRSFSGLTSVYHDTVRVSHPRATIQANDLDGCIGHEITLHAATHQNVSSYLWDFGNGVVSNSTDSFSMHQYLAGGTFIPSVIVKDNNGCAVPVTLSSPVVIYPDPVITVAPTLPVVCKAAPVQLHANGANTYEWSPVTGLSNSAVASPVATPASTTIYTVNGTDMNGCKGTGIITVTVPQPFAMQAIRNTSVCAGESTQLMASGAHSYEWINVTTGLSDTHVGNPVASPVATTTYTVAGYDQYRCYSDTERVVVTVHPLPIVNAGNDRQVIYGSPNQLSAATSNNVIRWNWSPATFLSCTNCASPISKPYTDIEYIITVHTANNCLARDTVKLAVACGEGNIYIPNAFTPDNDGKNDGFTINGYGVRMVRNLRIYNRWGEIVFERRNFLPNDASSAWRGKYKGMDAPAGAYVYLTELECAGGETFMRKGTVTLIR